MAFGKKSVPSVHLEGGGGGGGGQAYLDNVQLKTIFFSLKASLIVSRTFDKACKLVT